MSSTEIATVQQRYRARIEAILTPHELTHYNTYQQRLQDTPADPSSPPTAPRPDEQAVLDKLAADTQAAALHTQLHALLRIDILPK